MNVTDGFFQFQLGSLTFVSETKVRNNMKEIGRKELMKGILFLAAFAVWTVLIRYADVQSAGPCGTRIGLASLNIWFHHLTGVHTGLYEITDWLGLIPLIICLCFGMLGFSQLVKRRSIVHVDADIILLGIYYLLVITAYLFFEAVPVNYRPVLIEGRLEASYPSSTTLLVLSVMPSLGFQVSRRCADPLTKRIVNAFIIIFSVLMTAGRLLSGVHWITDITGSVFLSAGLYMLYQAAVIYADHRTDRSRNGIQ